MSRAGKLCCKRLMTVGLVVICHALLACDNHLPDADANAQRPAFPVAGSGSTTDRASATANPTTSTAAESSADATSAPESDCDSNFCVLSALRLSEYCDLEHAKCPADNIAARTLACRSKFALDRQAFVSSCGGNSIRIQYDSGAIDYHYGSEGALRAVTTVAKGASETCTTDVVSYGDASCQAGMTVALNCP